MQRYLINELYGKQRRLRCTKLTELQEVLLDRLRTILWEQEKGEASSRAERIEREETAERNRKDTAEISELIRQCNDKPETSMESIRQFQTRNGWVNVDFEGPDDVVISWNTQH